MFSPFLLKSIKPVTQNRALFIVWVVFAGFFLWLGELDNELKAIGGGRGVLDLQFAFTLERASAIISQWGIAGRSLALTGLFYDCFYPISYGLALMALIVRVLGPESKLALRVLWLPVVAVILDYFENFVHWRVIQSFPEMSAFSVALASGFAATKWALIAIAVSILLVAILRRSLFPKKSAQPG